MGTLFFLFFFYYRKFCYNILIVNFKKEFHRWSYGKITLWESLSLISMETGAYRCVGLLSSLVFRLYAADTMICCLLKMREYRLYVMLVSQNNENFLHIFDAPIGFSLPTPYSNLCGTGFNSLWFFSSFLYRSLLFHSSFFFSCIA